MIRVAIIDDHAVVRVGLKYMLQLDPELVFAGESDDGAGAVEFVRQHKPDVTFLDVRMPGTDGITALQAMLDAFPLVKVVMLTTSDAEEDVYRAIRLGAKGYVLKDEDPATIIKAVRTVAAGDTFFPDAIRKSFDARSQSRDLTPRETEILGLMAKGLSNVDIAATLGISRNSIKMHAKHIFTKLGVADRVEAVTAALSRGIISH